MRKTMVAAALIAASAFGATAHASWFGRDATTASEPFSLKSVYDEGLHTLTYAGKATIANPFAYEPSPTLLGLYLGDSLSSLASTCIKDAPVPLTSPCVLQKGTSGVIVAGLHDPGRFIEGMLPDLPIDVSEQAAAGQAFVGSDADGRIDAIVVPLPNGDALARVTLQAFANRFGSPASISTVEAVWNLPDGGHAKVAYEDNHLVYRHSKDPTNTKALYAAVYGKDGAATLAKLLNADWTVTTATK